MGLHSILRERVLGWVVQSEVTAELLLCDLAPASSWARSSHIKKSMTNIIIFDTII